jgi:ABC-2 type transport system ATP-binding protein
MGLSKHYGGRMALDDLSLEVPTGALFGFLGPNGAGKSTTLRILLGLLRASSGSASILGRDCVRDGPAVRREVGYLPGDVRFYDHLTGRQTLAFLGAARGGGHDAEARRLIEAFELDVSKRVRECSRGMKQKLGLIQALMHRPRLLILDEPTTALDPLVRETLYRELRSAAGDGRTVLFSSHTLSEVEALCDRVAIVRSGRLVELASIAELKQRALRHVEVRFVASPPGPPPGLHVIERGDGWLKGAWSGDPAALLAWLASARVADVSISPPDLEDLFMAYYQSEAA